MKIFQYFLIIILLTASSLMLLSCKRESKNKVADLHKYISDVKKQPLKKTPKLPTVTLVKSSEFQGSNMRSPFKPKVQEHKIIKRPRTELEAYPLSKLQLVGTIHQGNMSIALIRTPNGKIHDVKVGEYLGQRFGRVIKIAETRIEVEEKVSNPTQGYSPYLVTLKLKEAS